MHYEINTISERELQQLRQFPKIKEIYERPSSRKVIVITNDIWTGSYQFKLRDRRANLGSIHIEFPPYGLVPRFYDMQLGKEHFHPNIGYGGFPCAGLIYEEAWASSCWIEKVTAAIRFLEQYNPSDPLCRPRLKKKSYNKVRKQLASSKERN